MTLTEPLKAVPPQKVNLSIDDAMGQAAPILDLTNTGAWHPDRLLSLARAQQASKNQEPEKLKARRNFPPGSSVLCIALLMRVMKRGHCPHSKDSAPAPRPKVSA